MCARVLALILAAAVGAGCSKASPTAPSAAAPSLTFSVTPNPVPYSGLLAICQGTTVPTKSWIYTLQITNTGTAPFVASSHSARVTVPGTAPFDVSYSAADFAAAFGSSTIPPQGSVSSPLCVAGPYDSASLVWTFVGAAGGGSFSSPAIQFLPSGVPNGPSAGVSGFMRALVDGTSWNAAQISVVRGSAGITIIGEDASARRITIELNEPLAVTAPGYWLTFRDRLTFRLNDGALLWETTSDLSGGAIQGEVQFSTMTGSRAVGVFKFNAPPVGRTGAFGTKVVTEGVLDVTF